MHAIDREKGTIDVSIKRVSTKDAKEKIRSYNLEKRLVALFAQTLKGGEGGKGEGRALGDSGAGVPATTPTSWRTPSPTQGVRAVQAAREVKDAFIKALEQNKKQKRYFVSYIATISTYNTESGATELRGLMKAIKDGGIDVGYIGAPKYRLFAEGTDYTDAEAKIAKVQELISQKLKKGHFGESEGEAEEGKGGHNGLHIVVLWKGQR